MKTSSSENQSARAARRLVPRDLLWIVARNRSTSADETVGFWSDIKNTSAYVVDPATGADDLRDFYGAGGLITISDIPAVSSISVQSVDIVMSQLDEQVAAAVRTHDAKQARVEIYRGLFDPDTNAFVDAAENRFVGFVDTIEITTPRENEEGRVVLRCNSHTQELLRSNPTTRSNADQKRRSSTDDFFKDAAVVGEWDRQWGPVEGKVATQPSQRTGIFGLGGFLGIF